MLSLFLPEQCLHCGHPTAHALKAAANNTLGHYLCPTCSRMMEIQEPPDEELLREQFALIASGFPIAQCRSRYSFFSDSPIQSAIHAVKYSEMPRLARHFGRALAPLVPATTQIIVPIPLHRTRLAERGYNQAEALANGIVGARGGTMLRALKRTRPTPSQTQLTIPERIENMRGAFEVTQKAAPIQGKHVLLIDDVMTTGATLASAALALLSASPKSIGILTLAAAQK